MRRTICSACPEPRVPRRRRGWRTVFHGGPVKQGSSLQGAPGRWLVCGQPCQGCPGLDVCQGSETRVTGSVACAASVHRCGWREVSLSYSHAETLGELDLETSQGGQTPGKHSMCRIRQAGPGIGADQSWLHCLPLQEEGWLLRASSAEGFKLPAWRWQQTACQLAPLFGQDLCCH